MSARILLVDDLPANLELLQAILSKQDYEIVCAQSGSEALNHLSDHDFQVALVDVMMPDMNGYELCRRIREQNGASYLPVIFVTASEITHRDIVEGFAAGGDDYVCKPFDTQILLSRISACLRVKTLQDELASTQAELGRYVSRSTVQMVQGKVLGEASAESRKAEVTILFSDIRDFTHQTEHLQPEQVFEVLNNSLNFQLDLIQQHGGTIDKLNGDEIMALFEGNGMAERAVACARDILQAREEALNSGQRELPQLGIGINTGSVYLGSVGNSRSLLDYTAVGAPVNIAARLCGMARNTQALISTSTLAAITQETPPLRALGGQRIKGLSQPLEVYELLSSEPRKVATS